MREYYEDENEVSYFQFLVTERQFKQKLYDHFLGNDYLPESFLNNLTLKIRKLYLPAFYFKYYYETIVEGVEIEYYYETVRNPSTGTGGRIKRSRPYPFKSKISGIAEIYVSASEKNDMAKLFSIILYENYKTSITFNPEENTKFEEFEITIQQAESKRTTPLLHDKIRETEYNRIKGLSKLYVPYNQFGVDITAVEQQDSGKFFLPYWVFDYNYGGYIYSEMVDAVTGFFYYVDPIVDKVRESQISKQRIGNYVLGLMFSVFLGILYYVYFDNKEDGAGTFITSAICFLIIIIITESNIASKKNGWKEFRKNKLKEVFFPSKIIKI